MHECSSIIRNSCYRFLIFSLLNLYGSLIFFNKGFAVEGGWGGWGVGRREIPKKETKMNKGRGVSSLSLYSLLCRKSCLSIQTANRVLSDKLLDST